MRNDLLLSDNSNLAEVDSTTGEDLSKDVFELTDDDEDFKPTKRCKASTSPQSNVINL